MLFHEYPCEQIFDFVAESGLDGIEFWMETPHFWLRGCPASEVSACIGAHPELAPITVHAPILDLNPCSINPKVSSASVEYTLAAISFADRLQADVVTVHPGRRTAKRAPAADDYRRFERYIDALREASEGARVKVAIENMEPKVNSLLCTPGDVRELLDREEWLAFTLDMGHAMTDSPAEAVEYIECCVDRMVNVHVSAVRGGVPHYPTYGDPDASLVLETLADAGYRGNLTLELEDRHFAHDLSSEEKITLLMRELAFLMEIVS